MYRIQNIWHYTDTVKYNSWWYEKSATIVQITSWANLEKFWKVANLSQRSESESQLLLVAIKAKTSPRTYFLTDKEYMFARFPRLKCLNNSFSTLKSSFIRISQYIIQLPTPTERKVLIIEKHMTPFWKEEI